MGLALFRPEVGDAESFFEVGSEVVHVTDGEEDVEPELEDLEVGASHGWRVCALRTARVVVECSRGANGEWQM